MLTVTEDQVRAFRMLRHGLAGPGHATLLAAARAQVGGQAQLIQPTVLGLSTRTAGRPPASEVRAAIEADHALVRAWGQHDTVHVYDPADWPVAVAAWPTWATSSGRRPDPFAAATEEAAAAHLATLARPVTRTDFRHLVGEDWLAAIDATTFDTPDKRWRYAAGRLIWRLGHRGLLFHGPKVGREQSYWPTHAHHRDLPAPPDAPAHALARRYLRAYGPATVQDMAHFFGTKVTTARTWLGPDLVEVRCEERALWLCADDAAPLQQATHDTDAVRLLPGYDNLLMGHADKSWTVPVASERKAVWKKAAVVSAVVLDRGVVVATWKHKVRAKKVTIEVQPLSGWAGQDLTAEAQALADHLGRANAEVV